MGDNKNGAENWYAPLKGAAPETGRKRAKKRRTGWWIAGIALALFALIIGSSIALSDKGGSEPQFDYDSGELPENWQDFFDDYYTGVSTEKAQIDIPRFAGSSAFRLTLEKSGEEELTLKELYRQCSESIVAISGYTDGSVGYSWGTGIILSEDGLILTNTHVINKCSRATVTLCDNTEYEAMLVGADSFSDLAVLKINAANLKAASFGESAALCVGDKVAAIGNPLGADFKLTLTDGIISAIERGINYNGHSMTLLQTNTAINEGNSGGALFNMQGQVIGVTNMKMMSSYSSIEGIGFAIPSATVEGVVNSLIENGEVRGRTSIGITVGAIPETALSRYDLPDGLYISAVQSNSDAEAKGIKPGDILLAVNSVEVKTTEEVLAIKNSLEVGDTMKMTLWRDGETFDVDVVLMDMNDIY